jgi:hypothetical protein
MGLEELIVAVERHRQQMAPVVAELAGRPDGAVELFAGLLEESDRELGRLCVLLRQQAWPWTGDTRDATDMETGASQSFVR